MRSLYNVDVKYEMKIYTIYGTESFYIPPCASGYNASYIENVLKPIAHSILTGGLVYKVKCYSIDSTPNELFTIS